MANQYVVGIDAGTTGSRTVIFDLKGNEVANAYFASPLQFPRAGEVLCDPQAIIDGCYKSSKKAIAESGIDPKEIGSISFTMMRSSWVLRDADGNFLHDIIMWQDMRGTEMFPWMRQRLAEAGMTEMDMYNLTGFRMAALLPSSKMIWFKKYHRDIWDKAQTIHTIQALVSKAYGADDYYDNEEDCQWYQISDATTYEFTQTMCDIWDLEIEKFTKTYPAGTPIGAITPEVAEKTGFAVGTPLFVGSGDQQCGALGLGNIKQGMGSVCLGTAGLIIAVSPEPIRHPEGKNHVVGLPTCDGTKSYTIEGHASAAASSFRWFRDCFCDLEKAAANSSGIDVYDIMGATAANAQPGAQGCIYLPWLAGVTCPHYDANARGSFIGATFGHTKADMTRAAMEGVCFEMREMIEAVREADIPEFELLRLTGGAARSDLWNQISADIYGYPVETVSTAEATALGAAMIGAVGAGIFKSLAEAVENMVHVTNRYEPIPKNVNIYNDIYQIFEKAYFALKEEVFPAIAKFQGY